MRLNCSLGSIKIIKMIFEEVADVQAHAEVHLLQVRQCVRSYFKGGRGGRNLTVSVGSIRTAKIVGKVYACARKKTVAALFSGLVLNIDGDVNTADGVFSSGLCGGFSTGHVIKDAGLQVYVLAEAEVDGEAAYEAGLKACTHAGAS